MCFPRFLLIFLLFLMTILSFIKSANSIKCYVCEGVKECKNATLWECNKTLANYTQTYLSRRYQSVPWFLVSYIECYSETVTISTITDDEYYPYKGCIYTNLKGCSLTFRDQLYGPPERTRECDQCDWDMCNNAAKKRRNLIVLLFGLILLLIFSQT